MGKQYRYIGVDQPRLEGRNFVTGRAVYGKDEKIPGMLYGKVLRSPYAYCRIKAIDTSRAEALPGVQAVLTYKNAPAWKLGMPIPHKKILDEKAYFIGDGVALVAAVSEEIAEEACELIEVEYEKLKPVLSIDEALHPDSPQIYEDFPGNRVPTKLFEEAHQSFDCSVFGDPETGFSEADEIVEGDSTVTSAQNPLPPEPPVVIAEWEGDELTIRGSIHAPGALKLSSAPAMSLEHSKLRVIPSTVGASYGSKVISICGQIVMYTAALAKAAKRPVRIAYTKEEHLSVYMNRLKSKAHYKIGLKKHGTVTAITGQWDCDCGAASAEQGHMIGVGLISQPILAKTSHCNIQTSLVVTNTMPTGPYRGFGYLENTCHILNILYQGLEKIGMDPVDYFKHNRLQVGDPIYHAYMCAGFETCSGPDILPTIQKGAEAFRWYERFKGWDRPSYETEDKIYAVGVGNTGQSDVGEQVSNENVQLNYDGGVIVFCGAAEFGPGTRDVMRKIAAEVLNVQLDKVKVTKCDTDAVPAEWGSTGSRSTYSMGCATIDAAKKARAKLLEQAAGMLHCPPEALDTRDGMIFFADAPEKLMLPWIAVMGPNYSITGVGHFGGNYSIPLQQLQFVEIAVDKHTGKVELMEQVCATDCGQIINPTGLKGQLDGYFPGIDMATREITRWDQDGRIVNANMIDYKTRTWNELPKHKNVISETPPSSTPEGPFGAFGAGEPSLAPGIPAIVMAIRCATGKWFNHLPITPGDIQNALKEREER